MKRIALILLLASGLSLKAQDVKNHLTLDYRDFPQVPTPDVFGPDIPEGYWVVGFQQIALGTYIIMYANYTTHRTLVRTVRIP